MNREPMHAWYSAAQAELCGSLVYARADGTEVVVTTVAATSEHGTHWDDLMDCGEVVTFVRRISFGTMGRQEFGR